MKGLINEVEFESYLMEEEKAVNTIKKYLKDLNTYSRWIQGEGIKQPFISGTVAKKTALMYKDYLKNSDLKTNSINNKLASINSYMAYLGYSEKVKYIKVQRDHFQRSERELTTKEYEKLVKTARKKGNERLALIIETLAATGIRISELKYITVDGLNRRKIQVVLKGKSRVIYIPNKLCIKLQEYINFREIKEGEIFVTSKGTPIDRKQIWFEMKQTASEANIDYTKVFPHNMRHLFAKAYYEHYHDLSTLADILGHSNLETTRIYLTGTYESAERQLENLGLVK